MRPRREPDVQHASPRPPCSQRLADGTVEVVDLHAAAERDDAGDPAAAAVRQHAASEPRRRSAATTTRGPAWAWYTLEIGEHAGTHFDAPIHWVTGKDGADVASRRAEPADRAGVVIDKTAETEADNGYLLTVADLEAWEAENGRIPDGAWVLFRTGWESRAQDAEAFLNAGANGPVTPGPDVEASRWLASERGILGFGIETVGIDAGAAGGFDPPFPRPQLPARRRPLRPHPAREPRQAAADRRAARGLAAEARRRHRQPEPGVRFRA